MKALKKKGVRVGVAALALAFCAIAGSTLKNTGEQAMHVATPQIESIQEAAILKQGSSGNEVREVQRRLTSWGYYSGSVDGVFGKGTSGGEIHLQGAGHDGFVQSLGAKRERQFVLFVGA